MRLQVPLAFFGTLLFCSTAAQPSYPSEGCFIRYQYDAAGNRTQRDWICVSEFNGGGSKSLTYLPDSTSKLADAHLQVAPNPASNDLRVTLSTDIGSGQVFVHDAFGREIMQRSVQTTPFNMDVSTWPPGTYYLSFLQGKERIVTGFAIQR